MTQLIIAGALACVLAYASLRYTPLFALGVVVAAFGAYVAFKKPEFALLGILLATSTVVPEDQLPMFSVGISLHLSDFILLGLVGLIVARLLIDPHFELVHTSLDLPLLIFYGVTLLSTVIAVSQGSVAVEEARRWTRVLSYYLIFFAVTNLIRKPRQLYILMDGLFMLTTLVAGAMVVQFLVGDTIKLLPGRVEALATQGTTYTDITRILPPGWSLLLVMFVVLVCILAFAKLGPSTWYYLFEFGLIGAALVITFLRSVWAALIMVFFLLFLLLKGKDRLRLVWLGFTAIAMLVVVTVFLLGTSDSRVTRLLDATTDRLNTLGNGGTFQGQDGSLNWRMIENGYARPTIVANPWLGLGMGFTYRPWDPRLDTLDDAGPGLDFRTYIHNGHLWILLQSGLLGYLSLAWLSLAFLINGFKHWHSIAIDKQRALMLGLTLAYVAILVVTLVNPSFMQWRWTPIIGLVLGINEVILRFNRPAANYL